VQLYPPSGQEKSIDCTELLAGAELLFTLDFLEDFVPHCDAPVTGSGQAHWLLLQHSAAPLKQLGAGGLQFPLEDAGAELLAGVALLAGSELLTGALLETRAELLGALLETRAELLAGALEDATDSGMHSTPRTQVNPLQQATVPKTALPLTTSQHEPPQLSFRARH
jgi:hypothetical protein